VLYAVIRLRIHFRIGFSAVRLARTDAYCRLTLAAAGRRCFVVAPPAFRLRSLVSGYLAPRAFWMSTTDQRSLGLVVDNQSKRPRKESRKFRPTWDRLATRFGPNRSFGLKHSGSGRRPRLSARPPIRGLAKMAFRGQWATSQVISGKFKLL
jgi:hypothetical protein